MNLITLQSLGTSIEIPVPKTYDKIGIAMSGGMDSALLASLLFPHLDESKVTVYTVDLGDSVYFVKDILAKLGVNPELVVVRNPMNDNGALSPQFQQICNEVDYFYTGTTNNPEWASTWVKKPLRYVKTRWQNMLMPFGVSYKSHIADLYFKLNKQDLLPLTHTCTERLKSSCGKCFACVERKWAFEQINQEDVVVYEKSPL